MVSKSQLLCFLTLLVAYSLAGQTTINYLPSSLDFANPERGFYRYTETRSGNYSLLDANVLAGYRQLNTPPSAGYSVYSTLVFRYFFLEDFKLSPISASYLNNMQADFDAARQAGVKVIPRFAYTDAVDDSGCSSWICPPYGDADKARVLTHISQLAPVLEANKDVIACVQMGFIGVWGENYYTDYFGDASQAPGYKLSDQNWQDRIEVLNAMLAAVPSERMVQVRYPQKKQRTIYGINAPTSAAAITAAEAHTGSAKARIGFHNDCLLANADDFGTYANYGNSTTSSGSDTTNLKPYFANESRYVVVGGETCTDDYSPQNDCSGTNPQAYGDSELERMHYSYLNAQYNNDLNDDWVTGGCMDAIKRRLGYRFELKNGTYSDATQPGQVIAVDIDLENTGYAAPYNERGVELILRHSLSGEKWYAELPDDPRFWLANNSVHNISASLCIPADMPIGDYELLLNLPDPMPALYANPDYAIRVASLLPDLSDSWETATGYNKLGHTISIDNTTAGVACNGEITFSTTSGILPIELLYLRAFPSREKTISIEWATAWEKENLGFRLERSEDGRYFSEIGWIAGKGTVEHVNTYEWTDTDVELNTNYYYRLTQEDVDGTLTHSEVVSARVQQDDVEALLQGVLVFPNPTSRRLTIEAGESLVERMEVSLTNVLGHRVIPPSRYRRYLDLEGIPQGVYFLKLKAGQQERVLKVIRK